MQKYIIQNRPHYEVGITPNSQEFYQIPDTSNPDV